MNLKSLLPFYGDVLAHCDIPCGIYSLEVAKIAAKTVKTMSEKIQDSKDDAHSFTRFVLMKEKHAQICKDELTIICFDFFKPEHVKEFPELFGIITKAIELCSLNKRSVDMDLAEELCSKIEELDTIFQKVQEK